MRRQLVFTGLAFLAAFSIVVPAWAEVGPHGGPVTKVGSTPIEVVTTTTGITVYPLTAGLHSIDASHLTGTVTFIAPNATKPPTTRPLKVVETVPGRTPSGLTVKANLRQAPPDGAAVAFQIVGLDEPINFKVPFAYTPPPVTVKKATAADAPAIARQKVCVISGEDLHEMGMPLKLMRGSRSVFVCCGNCEAKVKADPDKYFAAATPHSTSQPSTPPALKSSTAADPHAAHHRM